MCHCPEGMTGDGYTTECSCEDPTKVYNEEKRECQMSNEPMCATLTGYSYFEDSNTCMMPATNCETAMCDFCVMIAGTDEEDTTGTATVWEKNVCVQCHEGLYNHEG